LLAKASDQAPHNLLEASLDTFFHQHLRRDLFHRKMCGIDVRNIFAAEQVFHFAHFEFALGVAGE
jgi:hypothetical protein